MPITDTEGMLNEIQSQRTEAAATAATYLTQAQGLMTTLVNEVEAIDPFLNSLIPFTPVDEITPASLDGVPDKPAGLDIATKVAQVQQYVGDEPGAYVPGDVGSLSPVSFDDFDEVPPEFVMPVSPDTGLPTAPVKPILDDIAIPVIGDITIPDAPTLEDIVIPVIPAFEALPAFTYSIPELTIEAPDPRLDYNEGTYTSDLHDATKAWLLGWIATGGTGLGAEVEAALFDRARAREAENQRRNLVAAADEFAAGGWPVPTGAARASLRRIRKDIANAEAGLSREILNTQAELAQKNTHFVIEKSILVEGMLREHFHKIADRALQVARATIEYAINVFDAKVRHHNLLVEQMKAELAVYEMRVKAAFHVIEYTKAQLEAARLRGDLQMQQIQRYQAQIQGAEALARIFTLRIEQAKLASELERQKLDIFRAEIDGYAAQLKAKETEYSLFTAKINAEEIKQRSFTAQVDAYRAILDGKRAQLDIQKSVIEAKIEKEKLHLEQHKMEMESYVARSSVVIKAIDAAIAEHNAKNETYRNNITAAVEKLRGEIIAKQMQQDVNKFNAEGLNRQYEAELRAMESLTKMKIDGAAGGAQYISQIIAALFSQFVNVLNGSGEMIKSE